MVITYPVRGVDLSYANAGDLSNPDSIEFAFVKATEGNSITDPRWVQHANWVLHHGKVLGAYHFSITGDGASQARHFLSVVGSSTKLVALDIEGRMPMTSAQSRAFIATCQAAGKVTGVYASEGNWPGSLGQDYNWVANYNGRTRVPQMPWAFWQWQGSPLDRDYFHGSADALYRLAGLKVAPPSQPPRYVVNIHGGHVNPTPLFATHSTSSRRSGPVYSATVTATVEYVNRVRWYCIVKTTEPSWRGKWFLAEPWMSVASL
jgi:hypothetical protein